MAMFPPVFAKATVIIIIIKVFFPSVSLCFLLLQASEPPKSRSHSFLPITKLRYFLKETHNSLQTGWVRVYLKLWFSQEWKQNPESQYCSNSIWECYLRTSFLLEMDLSAHRVAVNHYLRHGNPVFFCESLRSVAAFSPLHPDPWKAAALAALFCINNGQTFQTSSSFPPTKSNLRLAHVLLLIFH